MKKAALALTAALALAACKDDDDSGNTAENENTEAVEQAETADTKVAWSDDFVVDFEGVEVVLPNDRLFELSGRMACPSLPLDDNYAAACQDITADKAQYVVDVYACRGHGDAFYAAVPTNTEEAYRVFSHNGGAHFTEDHLFTEDGMRRQYENFGNDGYTVTSAVQTGTMERDFAAAMEGYITAGRGRHSVQDPVCSAHYEFNLGD